MRPQTDEATWPIAVLTSAFCPEFDPQRLAMAMCVGYFNGRDSRDCAGLFTVSGFVSSKVRWREFETRWSRQLRQEGLATFNATEWMNGTGEFASGWSDVPRRRGLMAALTRMTEQHVLHAFTQTISLSDYDAIDAEYAFGRAVGGPYNVCAALLMTTVRGWMAAKHPDDLTLFIFEQGDIDQQGLQRMLKGVRAETGEPAQIWPRRWRDERGRRRHLRPLEACQLFAADHDGSFQKRLTERSLLEAGTVDREQLTRVCRALGIAQRSVRDADEGRGVALGSL